MSDYDGMTSHSAMPEQLGHHHSSQPHHPLPVSDIPQNGSSHPSPMLDKPNSYRSAANEVYHLLEIKQQILALLDKEDLVSMLRLEKKGLYDVVQLLYHTVDYEWVWIHMKVITPRQQIYFAAVREIDCRADKFKMAPAMLEKTDITFPEGADPMELTRITQKYLNRYQAQVFNLVIPPMLRECGGLRRMHFGGILDRREQGDRWEVCFDAPMGTGKIEEENRSGHINYRRTLQISSARSPPSTVNSVFTCPLPPNDSYTISAREDITIQHDYGGDGMGEGWSSAAIRGSLFDCVHQAVELDRVPVTLDDLSTIYTRQASANYTERLNTISALALVPFDIPQFRQFAVISGNYLTSLRLLDNGFVGPTTSSPQLTFADLPTLTSLVKTRLPNLVWLDISLGDVETAEEICRSMLHEGILWERGSLEHLNVLTSRVEIPLFNVIRVLSPLCTSQASIVVSSFGTCNDSSEVIAAQRTFFRHLMNQHPIRQSRLATITFPSIGVDTLNAVRRLTYHEDGRPKGLWENTVMALGLSKKLEQAAGRVRSLGYKNEADVFMAEVNDFEEASETANTVELHGFAMRLNKLGYRMRKVVSVLEGDVQDDISEFVKRLEKEMMGY